MVEKIKKTDEQWRALLSEEQFQVTRRHGTERPFSGEYCESKQPGTYLCVCCGQPLFRSEEKYDSGSGWPSYWQPVNENAVETTRDTSHGMERTEVRCSRCDAHLGHVFPDGPPPTGLRYCINSLSLKLQEE
jgi:peptide-methionine (R)-S-oxide reductase